MKRSAPVSSSISTGLNAIAAVLNRATLVRSVALGFIAFTAILASGCASVPAADDSAAELTPAERNARAADLFAAMDLNGDGFLSRDEMTKGLRSYTMAGGGTPRTDLMLGLSSDAKKKARRKKVKPLGEEEIRRAVDQAFSSQDVDLDKRISQDEFRKIVVEKSDTSAPWQDIL